MAVTAEQALRAKFLASTGVAAYVSARIYPGMASRNGKLPLGVMSRPSSERHQHLGGAGGFQHPRIQVDWFANSYDDVVDLADKARLAADGFMGSVTVGSTSLTLHVCNLENQISDIEPPSSGEESPVHRITQDWIVGHAEATS